MKNIYNYLLVGCFVLIIFGFVWKIESDKNTIEELQKQLEDIEKPFYLFENGTYEHNYFKYSNVEFSSYTNKENFYGCHIEDRDQSWIDLYVYCNINKSFCKVEFKDLKCLDDYLEGKDIWNMTAVSLNEINCSKYYTVEGNVSERIY